MEEPTVAKILKEVVQTVKDGHIKSPDWWINIATLLSAMWQELKDDMTEQEMAYKAEISKKIEEGSKISQATLQVESTSEHYKLYQYFKGRDEIISEMIKIAKIRAKVDIL